MILEGSQRWGGLVGAVAALGFVAIVLLLHGMQPEYDARRQILSELALGPHGWAMVSAFGFLALSLLGVQYGLHTLPGTILPRALLIAAAAGMLAAGVFPLGRADELHVAAVALGFTMIVLTMYLLPARMGRLQSRTFKTASWLLGAGAMAGALAANFGVPTGLAQRLAAACVLGWLGVLSWKLRE